jgi:hypothetical protein
MRDWLDWALNWFLRLRGNRLARNAGYLIIAAIAAASNAVQLVIAGIFATFGLTITIPDTPWWVFVLFVSAAVVLLVVDRVKPETRSPNPHDVELFGMVRVIFDDDLMYFLRQHDFGGGSFERRPFVTLDRFNVEWNGERYRFEDPEMRGELETMLSKCRELTRLIALNTTPAPGNMDWCRPYWYDEDWHSEKTTAKVKVMNDTATEIAEAVDRLEVIARKKRIQAT